MVLTNDGGNKLRMPVNEERTWVADYARRKEKRIETTRREDRRK